MKLLRISPLLFLHLACCGQGAWAEDAPPPETMTDGSVQEAPSPLPDQREARLRPYDAEIYQLAYQVFLANRNLADAYLLAAAAVRQRPRDLTWRRRLAELASWTQRPTVALEQWAYIARHGRDPAAMDTTLNLARGLHDDEALATLLRLQLARDPDNQALWLDLINAYERLGRPSEAMALLDAQDRRRPRRFLLEQQAHLADGMGEPDLALAALDRLVRRYGPDPAIALQQADILFRRGHLHAALAKLQAAREVVPGDAEAFWQTLGDLAWTLQDDEDALLAARTLYAHGTARETDLERLTTLLRAAHPREALALAEEGWRKYHKPGFFFTMLDLGMRLEDWRKLASLYEQLSPEETALLEGNSYFWTARAQVDQKLHRWAAASAAYEKALALDPRSVDTRAAYLWLLLDQQDAQALRPALARWAEDAAASPGLWGPYAAGYAFLGEPAKALPFYRRQLPSRRNDYLWLINYADTLEQAGQAQSAYLVRRHAWLTLRRQFTETRQAPSPETLRAMATLAMQEAPGDTAARLMAQVAAGKQDPVGRELVLSWALSRGNADLARLWLWRRYADDLSQPRWAQLAIALDSDDREAIERLLRRHATALSIHSRVEAARRIGAIDLARRLAFAGLEKNPDDELHKQLQELMLERSNALDTHVDWIQRNGLERFESQFGATSYLTSRFALLPCVTATRQRSRDLTILGDLPAWDQEAELGASVLSRHGRIEAAVGRRQAVSSFTTARASATYRWTNALNTRLDIGYNQPAGESVPLWVGGVKDEGRLRLGYQLNLRDTLTGQVALRRYYSQDRFYLGSSRRLDLEISHALRFAYPDLAVRAFGSIDHYQPAAQLGGTLLQLLPAGQDPDPAFAIPPSFSQWGIGASVGDSQQNQYQRPWRPYAALDFLYNSITGPGYYGNLGIAGRVLGHDHLSVYFTQGKGTRGVNEVDRRAGIRYQYFF